MPALSPEIEVQSSLFDSKRLGKCNVIVKGRAHPSWRNPHLVEWARATIVFFTHELGNRLACLVIFDRCACLHRSLPVETEVAFKHPSGQSILTRLSIVATRQTRNPQKRPVRFATDWAVRSPPAPTIHLPDGWTLKQKRAGAKRADSGDDPVLCFFPSGTGDNRTRQRSGAALLSAVTTFNGYYDFPLCMSFFKIAESFSHAAQRVTSIYDRCNLSGFEEIFQKNQILLV